MSGSIDRALLHEIADDAACAIVDATLGAAEWWRSQIISYRLSSDFQAHWKSEIGHWIHTAQRCGYAGPLVERARARANHPRRRIPDHRSVDDGLYRVLLEELHPAMATHYLVRTGWGFRTWDEPDGAGADVDLAATSPDSIDVDLQIKAPGSENPIASVEHATTQLARSRHRTLVAVCSRDPKFPSLDPREFLTELVGRTSNQWGAVSLTQTGRFATEAWRRIGGVMLLDYIPGADVQTYSCTVITNPWCDPAVRIEPSWFPHARVLYLDGEVFRWTSARTPAAYPFPDGTYLPDELRSPPGG